MFDQEDSKSTAPELIPAGTISYAMVKVGEKRQSKATGGTMFNIELTLIGGQYEGRKVFDLLPDVTDTRNSEGFIKMGKAKIVHMFETIGFFKPSEPDTYRQFKDFVSAMTRLDGNRVAVKISIEKNPDPAYADRNKVAEYLSSNPASKGYRDYVKLIGGQQAVQAARAGVFAATAPAPASGTPGWVKTPTPQPSPSSDAPF
jgi:hypothetical protein